MAATKGLLIKSDKTIAEVTLDGYHDLSDAIGGYIEAVRLKSGDTMYVDEEFLIKGYGPDDFNSIASDVCGLGGRPDLMLTGILGPVVILGPIDEAGDDTDITPAARRMVKRVANEAGGRYVGEGLNES
jgi:Domain of unknown function (DUF3846)